MRVVIAAKDTHLANASAKSFADAGFEVIVETVGSYDFGKYRRNAGVVDTLYTHDSSLCVDADVVRKGFQRLVTYDLVVPYWFRPNHWDSDAQRAWVRSNFDSDDYDVGVFGPIFFARAGAAQRLFSEPLRHDITTKWQQQAMERGVGVLAKQLGLSIWHGNDVTGSFSAPFAGTQGISKTFPQRS